MQIIGLMLIVLLAGAMLPLQVGLNHKMGKAIFSPEYASFISFVVGAIGLLIYLLFIKQDLTTITNSGTVAWYVWLAGLLGAFYVTVVIIVAPKLGVAFTFGLIITGQMLISIALDHFGLLGIPVKQFNWGRLLGILLLIAGVLIIRRS